MSMLISLRKIYARELFQLLIITASIFFIQISAHAQGGVGSSRGEIGGTGGKRSIKGQIYLSDRGDLGKTRFKVYLESADQQTLNTLTDGNGQFNFNALLPGNYTVVIEETKEYESMRELVQIDRAAGSPVYIIPVFLRLKPSVDPEFASVPKPALEHYIKGMEAVRKGDGKKAIEKMNAAIAAYPSFPQALTELGVQYLKKGDIDKALEALQNASKLKPDSFDARLYYGIALLQKQDFVNAETELRAAVQLRDTAATPHIYLGISLVRQKKNYEEAQTELEKGIGLPGGDNMATAHQFLGGIYWGQKDYQRAADELEKYLQLSPKAPDAERTRSAIKDLRSKVKQ